MISGLSAKTVKICSLQRALCRMDELDEARAEALMEEFADRQPLVLGYLLAMEEGFHNTEDFQSLLQLSVVIWLAFRLQFESIPKVLEHQVEQKECESMAALMGMTELDQEALVQSAIDAAGAAVQPVLHEFIASELLVMEEDGELIDKDCAGQMYSVLKIVIELLHDAVNKPYLRVV